jgi:hypothetical protein
MSCELMMRVVCVYWRFCKREKQIGEEKQARIGRQ